MARLGSVENAIVIGIFVVIVSILGIAVWGVGDSGEMFESGASGGGAPGLNTSSEASLPGGDSPIVIIPEVMQRALEKTRIEREKVAASQKSKVGQLVGNPDGKQPSEEIAEEVAAGDVDVTEGELVASDDGTEPVVVVPEPTEYRVQEGDNIWTIARDQYGEGDVLAMIDVILQHNPKVGNAELIHPGTILQLPSTLPQDVQTPSILLRADSPMAFETYVVQDGDSLQKIAREQLGDMSRRLELWELNRDVLEDPDMIHPGTTLRLPKSP
ncbi:MAG: LysM peptidoglycan-binding domain-containing protein [Planctomycetota bacterium]|nr:LysM peptidoglycan-binding domain-containing protein [Planctomycetota bacterium]